MKELLEYLQKYYRIDFFDLLDYIAQRNDDRKLAELSATAEKLISWELNESEGWNQD
jgi:hypothetical protein